MLRVPSARKLTKPSRAFPYCATTERLGKRALWIILFRPDDVAIRYSATWFADNWGVALYPYFLSAVPMEDLNLSVKLGESLSLCIAPLPGRTYRETAKGLGGEFGYFIFE